METRKKRVTASKASNSSASGKASSVGSEGARSKNGGRGPTARNLDLAKKNSRTKY